MTQRGFDLRACSMCVRIFSEHACKHQILVWNGVSLSAHPCLDDALAASSAFFSMLRTNSWSCLLPSNTRTQHEHTANNFFRVDPQTDRYGLWGDEGEGATGKDCCHVDCNNFSSCATFAHFLCPVYAKNAHRTPHNYTDHPSCMVTGSPPHHRGCKPHVSGLLRSLV